MTNKLTVKKVPLEEFINLLTDMYELGANFIDLIAINEDDNDTIQITVKEGYLEERKAEEKHCDSISEDDLNRLIV
jgi:hypothetical protein